MGRMILKRMRRKSGSVMVLRMRRSLRGERTLRGERSISNRVGSMPVTYNMLMTRLAHLKISIKRNLDRMPNSKRSKVISLIQDVSNMVEKE